MMSSSSIFLAWCHCCHSSYLLLSKDKQDMRSPQAQITAGRREM